MDDDFGMAPDSTERAMVAAYLRTQAVVDSLDHTDHDLSVLLRKLRNNGQVSIPLRHVRYR